MIIRSSDVFFASFPADGSRFGKRGIVPPRRKTKKVRPDGIGRT
jgi:hypothetical protein